MPLLGQVCHLPWQRPPTSPNFSGDANTSGALRDGKKGPLLRECLLLTKEQSPRQRGTVQSGGEYLHPRIKANRL